MMPNPKEVIENSDPDICIQIRHITARQFPYPSDHMIRVYHNGREKIKNYTGRDSEEPKDGDICPECGGRLTERKGPYGTFIGCKNYPDCRYNRKHW